MRERLPTAEHFRTWRWPAPSGPRTASQAGMSFVAVLFGLLILAMLYFGYFEFQRTLGEKSTGTTAIDRTRDFACRTNRQTVERQIMMWRVDHEGEPLTLEALGSLSTCPEGGHYSLSGGHVLCSLHP